MLECRYYGNCYFMECDVPDKCDGKGNCESYSYSHEIKTVCQFYSPMPDVEALTALADELEEDACWEVQTPGNTSVARRLKDTCDRIREALGVSE